MYIDINKREEQQLYIREQILRESSNNNISILNNEACVGKTYATEEALVIATNNNRKSILIRADIEDSISSRDRINTLINTEIAFALNNETTKNTTDFMQSVIEYPILILTHQKYKLLSEDKTLRNKICKDRDILVIDEFVDIVDKISVTLDDLHQLIKDLRDIDIYLANKFKVVKDNLDSVLINTTKLEYFEGMSYLSRELNEIIKIIEATELDVTKSKIINRLKHIKCILNNTSIKDRNAFYGYNSQRKMWLLNNTVMLDASAGINYINSKSNLYILDRQERIIDYSNWCFNICKFNSSKYNINKTREYFDTINNHLKELSKDKKVLVIGNKESRKKILVDDNIEYDYFGNLVGKNNYKDYSCVYVIINHQFSFANYVIDYMYYNNNREIELDCICGYDNVYRFRNQELEEMRVNSITANLYQAIKRINRDNSKKTEVYIINSDNKVITKLLKEFRNATSNEIDLGLNIRKKSNVYQKKRLVDAFHTKFINFLEVNGQGVYTKEEIREAIGYSDKKSFSRKILNHLEVKQYMELNNIRNERYNIIFPHNENYRCGA